MYEEKRKIYIERKYEGTTMECKDDLKDVEEAIIEEYKANEVCIGEILESLCIHGLSIPEVVTVYSKIYKRLEDDITFRIADGELLDLTK